jgi:hypothetical protein
VLRNFSFAMLIGLTSGVYTTMCLVPGLVYQWTKDGNYTALAQDDTAGVAHNARHGAAGFEQPKKKNKKRHG